MSLLHDSQSSSLYLFYLNLSSKPLTETHIVNQNVDHYPATFNIWKRQYSKSNQGGNGKIQLGK